MNSILDVSSMYDTYASSISSTSASSLKDSLESVNSDSDDEEEGEYLKYFGDTLTQAYADAITDSGEIGLAQQLYDSMKQSYKI